MITFGSRAVATALAVALGLALAAPAAAQPAQPAAKPAAPAAPAAAPAAPAAAAPKADAKASFASGEKKFKAGDFAGALADFEASNAAKPAPDTDRYIALCHDNLQHYPEAVAAFEKFIASNPPKKDQLDEAKHRVEAIKGMPGKVHVETTPPGASVVLDGAPAPYEKVTPADIDLPPGKHTLLIGAEGFENATKEVEVGYGSKQDLKVDLVKKEAPPPPPPVAAEAPAPAPPPPPPPPEPRSKVPAYVTGAVAIVAAGVGTAFGIAALNDSSDFKNNPTTSKADDGENNALVADMMFGVAITFGVTSAVLFLSSDTPAAAKADPRGGTKTAAAKPAGGSEKKSQVKITPTPFLTHSGGGAGALVSF